MFERGKKDGPEKQAETPQAADTPRWSAGGGTSAGRQGAAVIGRSIRIDGDLQGEEDLRIEGDVTGTIQLRNSTLTIGSEGKIRASVYARSVAVDGFVEGDLYGSERVIIRKTAQVKGNVTAPRVSLEDGAKFKGSIEMDPDAVASAGGAGGKQSQGTAKPTAVSSPTPADDKVVSADPAARKAR